MTRFKLLKYFANMLVAAALVSALPALADRPSWSGGKHEQHRKKDKQAYHRVRNDDYRNRRTYSAPAWQNYRGGQYFVGQQRSFVRNYYDRDFRRGFCPPGLAKKHNGCLPPGQARKWVIGRPLPRGVPYYALPPNLAMGIGVPPPGYQFVRVASDILMIAIGTGIVVDAINDLGR